MDTQWWSFEKVTPFRHGNSLVSMLYIWGVVGGLGPAGLDSWFLLTGTRVESQNTNSNRLLNH